MSSSSPQLSTGTIRRIHALGEGNHHNALSMENQDGSSNLAQTQPILQAITILPVKGKTDRFRIILSDGEYYCQGMLATQLNPLVLSNQLQTNDIVQIQDYMNNRVKDKLVLIVLNLTIVAKQAARIGSPVDLEKSGVVPVAAAAATTAPAAPLYPPQQQQQLLLPLTNSTNANPYSHQQHQYHTKPPAVVESMGRNPYGHRPGSAGGSAPIVRENHTSSTPLTPIAGLNMYNNRWTIRARVTAKSDIKTWNNAKGEGSLFSIDLLDSSGMDIRATFFKEAVDQFYPLLQIGNVYTLAGGKLKVANARYNTCKSNMEITFDTHSEIHLVPDGGDIQKINYDFQKIASIESVEAEKYVDILAVVKTVTEPVTLTSKKSGQELTKCDVTLVDDSGVEINLTLWGDKARHAPLELQGNPVVAARRCRVSDYGGKSVSAGDALVVQPDLPEAAALRQWWQTQGSTGAMASRSLSSSGGGGAGRMDAMVDRKTVASIKEDNLGMSDQFDWLSFKATVSFVKCDKEGGAWYPACFNAGEPCRNRFKVTQTTDGQWYCDKCQGSYPKCVRRWIFSGVVEDDTSSTWVSFFNEQAEALLGGATADDVYDKSYGEGGYDQDAYESIFSRARFTEWIMKCKVKKELVNDEARVKTSVHSLLPVDYLKESKDMLAEIAKF